MFKLLFSIQLKKIVSSKNIKYTTHTLHSAALKYNLARFDVKDAIHSCMFFIQCQDGNAGEDYLLSRNYLNLANKYVNMICSHHMTSEECFFFIVNC